MSGFDEIYDWTPDNKDLDGVQVQWIDQPNWALNLLPPDSTGPDGITSRETLKSGELVTQWEFSAATFISFLICRIVQRTN